MTKAEAAWRKQLSELSDPSFPKFPSRQKKGATDIRPYDPTLLLRGDSEITSPSIHSISRACPLDNII